MKIKIVLFVLLLPCFGMALQKPKGNGFSKDQVFHHVETLSSDAYEGRRSGQPGNKLGRVYIMDVFQSYGIDPFKGGYEQPFSFSTGDASLEASNVIGFVKGKQGSHLLYITVFSLTITAYPVPVVTVLPSDFKKVRPTLCGFLS